MVIARAVTSARSLMKRSISFVRAISPSNFPPPGGANRWTNFIQAMPSSSSRSKREFLLRPRPTRIRTPSSRKISSGSPRRCRSSECARFVFTTNTNDRHALFDEQRRRAVSLVFAFRDLVLGRYRARRCASFLSGRFHGGNARRCDLGTPRARSALLDAGTTLLLLLLLGGCRWRFLAAAAYWLNPLSIIFSAYHGNTDSAVAFSLVLCVWLLSKDKLLAAAIALGVSLWIKLPTVLAVPALLFFIPDWRRRFQFLLIAGVVALATYIPALVQDPAIVWENVFGYRAQILHTTAGVPAWGPRVLLFSIIAAPQSWPVAFRAPILFFLENGWLMAVALAFLVVWLRRSSRSVPELCATIAGIYIIVLTLSDGFSFQYFAWSLPFWFFLPRWFFIPAIVLVSGYIYFLYAYLCGNPWLLGVWDFTGHSYWPFLIIVLRNAAYLLFCAAAIWFLIATTAPAFRVRR